jgi:hypothetical protein
MHACLLLCLLLFQPKAPDLNRWGSFSRQGDLLTYRIHPAGARAAGSFGHLEILNHLVIFYRGGKDGVRRVALIGPKGERLTESSVLPPLGAVAGPPTGKGGRRALPVPPPPAKPNRPLPARQNPKRPR